MHGRESPRPHQWTFQAHRPTSAPTPDPRKPTTGERGSTHPGTPTKYPDTPHTMTAEVVILFSFAGRGVFSPKDVRELRATALAPFHHFRDATKVVGA